MCAGIVLCFREGASGGSIVSPCEPPGIHSSVSIPPFETGVSIPSAAVAAAPAVTGVVVIVVVDRKLTLLPFCFSNKAEPLVKPLRVEEEMVEVLAVVAAFALALALAAPTTPLGLLLPSLSGRPKKLTTFCELSR